MAKLSRTEKNKQLYDQVNKRIETLQQPEAAAAARPVRMAAPDKASKSAARSDHGSDVLDSLIGEVTQYNLANGDLVTEDTQMQILYDLSDKTLQQDKRSRHLEQMEANEEAGGTTRNIYGGTLSDLQNASAPSAAVMDSSREREVSHADLLDIISLSQAQEQASAQAEVQLDQESAKTKSRPEKIERAKVEKPAAKKEEAPVVLEEPQPVKKEKSKKEKKDKKERSQKQAELMSSATLIHESDKLEEEEKSSGKALTIVMVVICIILVCLIVATIYWMSQIGVF